MIATKTITAFEKWLEDNKYSSLSSIESIVLTLFISWLNKQELVITNETCPVEVRFKE